MGNDLTEFGTMSLGKLIDALESQEMAASVYFDFGGLVPLRCASYRGYYDHLALSFGTGRQNIADILTVLRAADGATFQGYKGGDYTMSRETPIWVAQPGDWTSTAIVSVYGDRDIVYIVTQHVNK